MKQDELINLLQEILEVTPGTVVVDSDLRELNWDSLADISLIAAIDERLGVVLDPLSLASCETPADIWEMVLEALESK